MANDIYMDIHKIIELLPHRYPFLLVDRVLECEPGKFLTAVKNVTMNEPFFAGHFPQRPVMPGVMILEAMAQATGLLTFATYGGPEANTLYYFVGIDKARFKRKVEPGDQLILTATLLHRKRLVWKFAVEARVDGILAAEAELLCAARKFET